MVIPLATSIPGISGAYLNAFSVGDPESIRWIEWLGSDPQDGACILSCRFDAARDGVRYPVEYDQIGTSNLSGRVTIVVRDSNGMQWQLLQGDASTIAGKPVDSVDKPPALMIASASGGFPRQNPHLLVLAVSQQICSVPLDRQYLDQPGGGRPETTSVFSFFEEYPQTTWSADPLQFLQLIPQRIYGESVPGLYSANYIEGSHRYCFRDLKIGDYLLIDHIATGVWPTTFEEIGNPVNRFCIPPSLNGRLGDLVSWRFEPISGYLQTRDWRFIHFSDTNQILFNQTISASIDDGQQGPIWTWCFRADVVNVLAQGLLFNVRLIELAGAAVAGGVGQIFQSPEQTMNTAFLHKATRLVTPEDDPFDSSTCRMYFVERSGNPAFRIWTRPPIPADDDLRFSCRVRVFQQAQPDMWKSILPS